MPPTGNPANPALQAFIPSVPPEKVWAQVLIQPADRTFTLRHVADHDLPPNQLKRLSLSELRQLAMFTASGQFRPLRSSPDLPRGWTFTCDGPEELWRALQELYPGSIPDWFAAESPNPPITHYRDLTNRQTGMYRITQLLSDDQAAMSPALPAAPAFVSNAAFGPFPALLRTLPPKKSAIPCLEPCAILLELARKAARYRTGRQAQRPIQQ
jgi:sirohydrochlorin cobaltochelatase